MTLFARLCLQATFNYTTHHLRYLIQEFSHQRRVLNAIIHHSGSSAREIEREGEANTPPRFISSPKVSRSVLSILLLLLSPPLGRSFSITIDRSPAPKKLSQGPHSPLPQIHDGKLEGPAAEETFSSSDRLISLELGSTYLRRSFAHSSPLCGSIEGLKYCKHELRCLSRGTSPTHSAIIPQAVISGETTAITA